MNMQNDMENASSALLMKKTKDLVMHYIRL